MVSTYATSEPKTDIVTFEIDGTLKRSKYQIIRRVILFVCQNAAIWTPVSNKTHISK
jgi:hypothetical protein